MDWEESRQEELDQDLMGYLLNHKNASEDFLIYLEENLPEFQKMLNEWLGTKEGKRWYENQLEAMIDDRPEREHDERDDR